jgi:type II restriction enzyme
MLGVKTTVKDRWRQVLDEAARIPEKHLFTLAEGVSPEQFAQMEEAGVRLVVPASNVTRFPAEVRARLLTLADFVGIVTTL